MTNMVWNWLFMPAWFATLAYLVIAAAVGLRLRRLRKTTRGQHLPDLFNPFGNLALLRWLFSPDYHTMGDQLLLRLVPVMRIMLCALIPVYLLIFGTVFMPH